LDTMTQKIDPATTIPIARFNDGEAGKIFDEVKKSGYKVVTNGDVPVCVLLAPERYEKMMEMIIDHGVDWE